MYTVALAVLMPAAHQAGIVDRQVRTGAGPVDGGALQRRVLTYNLRRAQLAFNDVMVRTLVS